MKLPAFRDPVTGEASVSLTLLVLVAATVLFRVCFGGSTWFGHTFTDIADETITSLLVPTYALYFGRKGTSAMEGVAIAKVEVGKP